MRHASIACLFQMRADWEADVYRLTSILQKRTLAPAKLDELKVKANILGAFKKVEEVVARATAEL